MEVNDAARGQTRIAVLADGRLKAALYLSRSGGLPSRDWLIGQLDAAEETSPLALLAGRPARPAPDRGPIVCVCFDVGMKTIISAITSESLTTLEEVGVSLKAGTNRSEEHTSELQSLMRISYAVFCLKKNNNTNNT